MPEGTSQSVVRLLSLVAWLWDHPGVGVDEAAAHFGRSKRQMLRDARYLAEVGDSLPGASLDLDWERLEEDGALVIRSALGADAPLRLSAQEATAILIGLQALSDVVGDEYQRQIPGAAMAVRALASEDGGGEVTLRSRGDDQDQDAALRGLFDALGRAIAGRERVSFTYTNGQGGVSSRRVSPWALERSATGWILRGWCHGAEAERSFRLDGIEGLEAEGGRARPAPRTGAGGGAPSVLRLRARRGAAWVVDEYGARVAGEHGDGTLALEVPVWDRQWALSLLIDLAPHVVSVDAQWARGAADRARSALARWREAGEAVALP